MKRLVTVLTLLLLASLARAQNTTATLLTAAAAWQPQKPEAHFADIARQLARMLPAKHLSQAPFGDAISQKAWTNFLNSVDFDRTLLTAADITRLQPMQTQIDDQIRAGDVSFGFDLHNLIIERLESRHQFVTNALAAGLDFSLDEHWVWQRKDLPWPKDKAQQHTFWRLQLKNEYLSYILGKEIDVAEAERKKQKEAQNPPAEKPETEKQPGQTIDLPPQTPEEIIAKRYQRLLEAFREMDSETVLQRYLSAVSQAYDPHTDYMSPMTAEDFAMGMNLTLYGIGATLRSEDGLVKVMELMPGSPAERDERDIRLVEGDKIIGVGQGDDPIEDIQHKPLNRVVRKIRGPKGTKVVLQVIPVTDPMGTTTKIVDLIRDEIKLEEQAVTGRVETVSLPEDRQRRLGYVRVPTFYGSMDIRPGNPGYRSMTDDLLRYITEFNDAKVEGLVIDLRNNGGGSLIEAVRMVDLFVKGPVVQIREPLRITPLSTAGSSGVCAFRKPVVVLINRVSASASEIVAGAFQDYGRAILVGDRRTHGKGTVQTVLPFNERQDGSERLTTASFYRVNGSSTQMKGVEADIIIPSPYDVLKIGEDTLTGALPWTAIQPAYYGKISDPSKLIPALREKACERLAENAEYARHCRLIRRIEEMTKETSVPLEINTRRAKIQAEYEIRRIEEEELNAETEGKKPQKDDRADIILTETFAILSDYIDLFGSGDVVTAAEDDLRSRMFRLFGF